MKHYKQLREEIVNTASRLLLSIGDGFFSQETALHICTKYINLDIDEKHTHNTRAEILYKFGVNLARYALIYEEVLTELCPFTTIISTNFNQHFHSDVKQIISQNQLQGLVGALSMFDDDGDHDDDSFKMKVFASDEKTLVILKTVL